MYNERGQIKKYKYRAKAFDVLDGNNFSRIKRLPLNEINRYRMVYIGQINRDCRLDEAIEAVASLKGRFPAVGLDIISSGAPETEGRLKSLAAHLKVTDRVTFHGQIKSPEIYENLIKKCGLGLCLYEINADDLAWYGTPLKIYLYASCGVPTIASDTMGPFTKEYFEKEDAGILSGRGTLKDKVEELFSNDRRYAELRARTIQWAAPFDYDAKFDKYLSLV
jgi:glycosyltransferase involved in cell wall biosynthesis